MDWCGAGAATAATNRCSIFVIYYIRDAVVAQYALSSELAAHGLRVSAGDLRMCGGAVIRCGGGDRW